MIEKPLLTFPSVKHAIVKDGVVQHQVMQRWAWRYQSCKVRDPEYICSTFFYFIVGHPLHPTNSKSDLKRVKILSGANKSFKKLVIMF